MALSDCPKCWDTPCTCGYEYRNQKLPAKYEKAIAALGVEASKEFHSKAGLLFVMSLFEYLQGVKDYSGGFRPPEKKESRNKDAGYLVFETQVPVLVPAGLAANSDTEKNTVRLILPKPAIKIVVEDYHIQITNVD